MRDFIKKNELWVFLALGPVVNAFFVYARYKQIVPQPLYNTGRFCVLLLFLIFLVLYTRGIKGVLDIFKPMLNWKVNPKWYLFGLLFAFTVGLFTLLLKGVYAGSELTSFLKTNFGVFKLRSVMALFVWAFLGEVVWVSYCIRELMKITKPFYASQIVGFVWTLWWIPIILLGEGVLPGIPIVSLGIFMLGIAGMCTIVYGNSKSGLCVLILQFMVNITLNALSLSPSTGGVKTFTAYSVVYFLVMLVFMYFLNPIKKMRKQSFAENSSYTAPI